MINTTISPSEGSNLGGSEITINGNGFTDMAWKNLTSDGNAYTWTTTTANYVYYSGWDPSIGVDSNGTVHIAHSNLDSDDFWLSSYDGSTWTHLKIRDCDMCSNADLVIDSNDNVHIAYYHSISGNGYLLYTMYDGTSWSNNWSTSNVENDQISITLDANDRPHISYSRDGYICNAALLSYYDGSSWTTVTLDSTSTYVGCDSSITIDSNGYVHVAYRHHGNMDMKIASNISGSWQRYLVDSGNGVGYHSAMAVDSNDNLHIVYSTNAAGNTVYYAEGASGSAWSLSNEGNSRNTFSMYIDQFDIVHISEYKGGSDLGYSMTAPGGTRQSMTIDSVGDVGYGNDIVVDDNNMVHVAYFDSSNKLLKYANRSTGMYMSQEVTVQFGQYGNVTGTVVDNSTIRVTAPAAMDATESVTMTVWGADGNGYDLSSTYRYYSDDDVDSDGVLNNDDDCPDEYGLSSVDLNGCPDRDGDGVSDVADVFPDEPTQSTDTDGDGCGDAADGFNGDQFPSDPTQCADTDGDGYGDNQTGAEPDDCPSVAGNSTYDGYGCPDNDGDGWSNSLDAFPDDANETIDSDSDGVGDNSDAFPNNPNESLDSDGDGVGDNADAFPFNSLEMFDSDGDGVGDNSDMFPNDANETVDTDGDGVGDNGDLFPNDNTEWADSDGDGVGDNSDPFPFLSNTTDGDGDGYFDSEDQFPEDSTQWNDSDNDGFGDNPLGNDPDSFPNNPTQWADFDGDGYGDNWGIDAWNTTRLFVWPGQFVENALMADHCPTEYGNSTVDGFTGCPDSDMDGIPDIYDLLDDLNAGIPIDSDGDGIPDQLDTCPNTPSWTVVDFQGCEIEIPGEENSGEESFFSSLLAGDGDTLTKTVGVGAILLALFAMLQTNAVMAVLPDAFRWMQVVRTSKKLSKEEMNELTYLQSLVQAYYADMETLVEELQQLNSDITARYTNNEIRKDTREKLITLIDDLLSTSPEQMKRVAYNDAYFGLLGTTDTVERTKLLQEEIAMRDSKASEEALTNDQPSASQKGTINEQDGHEYLESPSGSGTWFIRNLSTGEWDHWEQFRLGRQNGQTVCKMDKNQLQMLEDSNNPLQAAERPN